MTEGYRALREGAAVFDLSSRGKIQVRGEDRVRLLHAITTNHVEQLGSGQGCYAFFLNPQGRILADVNLFRLPDHLLLDTEPETREKILRHIDRYIIADDVTLEDVTSRIATIAVEGPKAEALLRKLGGTVPAEPYHTREWNACRIARLSATGAAGYWIFAPAGEKADLLARLAASGVDGVWLQGVLYTLAPFPWDPALSARYEERLDNLRELVARARRYGIGIYLYLNEPRAMPVEFFGAYPELRGVTDHGDRRSEPGV